MLTYVGSAESTWSTISFLQKFWELVRVAPVFVSFFVFTSYLRRHSDARLGLGVTHDVSARRSICQPQVTGASSGCRSTESQHTHESCTTQVADQTEAQSKSTHLIIGRQPAWQARPTKTGYLPPAGDPAAIAAAAGQPHCECHDMPCLVTKAWRRYCGQVSCALRWQLSQRARPGDAAVGELVLQERCQRELGKHLRHAQRQIVRFCVH